MRRLTLISGLFAACFWCLVFGVPGRLGDASPVFAQAQSNSTQDSSQPPPDAPPPQGSAAKKQTPRSGEPPKPGQSSTPPSSPSDSADNPFPEDVSRQAAKQAGGGSQDAQPPAKDSKTKPAAESNPFPEDVSREAAKEAGNLPGDSDKSVSPNATPGQEGNGPGDSSAAPPPGSSSSNPFPASSSSSSSGSNSLLKLEPISPGEVTDPARAKEDTRVGDFYMGAGNYQGAYLRFKDAMASDPGSVDAIFGVAEAARLLGHNAEAAKNYKLYLEVVPKGGKAKQALKALSSLPPG